MPGSTFSAARGRQFTAYDPGDHVVRAHLDTASQRLLATVSIQPPSGWNALSGPEPRAQVHVKDLLGVAELTSEEKATAPGRPDLGKLRESAPRKEDVPLASVKMQTEGS